MSDDIKPNAETSPDDGVEFDKSEEVQKSNAGQSFQDSSSDNEPGQEGKNPDTKLSEFLFLGGGSALYLDFRL